jgi:hypothetical protein
MNDDDSAISRYPELIKARDANCVALACIDEPVPGLVLITANENAPSRRRGRNLGSLPPSNGNVARPLAWALLEWDL